MVAAAAHTPLLIHRRTSKWTSEKASGTSQKIGKEVASHQTDGLPGGAAMHRYCITFVRRSRVKLQGILATRVRANQPVL